MTVIESRKDLSNLTLTFVAEFDAEVAKVWQIWEDPRKLERWWGPPTWPATFTHYEFVPGGDVKYHMTGPSGETAGGWWKIVSIAEPTRLEFVDGFADVHGNPVSSLPKTSCVVTLEAATSGRTRMTVQSTFASLADLEQVLEMGMEEGMREAMTQIDALLS